MDLLDLRRSGLQARSNFGGVGRGYGYLEMTVPLEIESVYLCVVISTLVIELGEGHILINTSIGVGQVGNPIFDGEDGLKIRGASIIYI